ncbi:MAG: ribonuclease P protein component [Candidatus Izemoplasmataceae bacterium]
MEKKYRIKDSKRIQSILNTRRKTYDGCFSVYVDANEVNHIRYALSVGKKFGNAVKRNKVKRRIRMILHTHLEKDTPMDVFIIIRPDAANLTYGSIEKRLIKLLKAHKLIRGEKK